jgi:hypothetical protein
MKKIIFLFSISTIINCLTIPKNNYEIIYNNDKLNFKNKSIIINIFKDSRKGENIDKSLMFIIPFFISGDVELNFPESDRISVNNPIKYFIADILKKEVENNFEFYSTQISESSISADYFIQGEIKSFYCTRKVYAYGLSIYGILLWYFGAPAISHECDINIEVKLKDSSNNILYNKLYNEKNKIYSGLYYNMFDLNKVYNDVMKKMMDKIIIDLKENLVN